MARILIVDDDPNVVELVRELLSMQNHALDTASDGKQGLAKLQAAEFDLLIIDRNMPVMNGIETILAIRRDPRLASLKILMFTSISGPAILEEARGAGADGCLHKPIHLAEFSAAVRQALEKRPPQAG